MPVFEAATNGLLLGLSLIVVIGAQNSFVLRQGLLGSQVFWVCLFCATSDAILIGLGVYTFSEVTGLWAGLTRFLAIFGAAFLFFYGASRLRAAWQGNYDFELGANSAALVPTLATAAILTWANPHVYLDTFGLIGAISANYLGSDRIFFALGAIGASFGFFFSLGYGARLLAPLFNSPRSWRYLDTIIGIVMFQIAFSLLWKFAW